MSGGEIEMFMVKTYQLLQTTLSATAKGVGVSDAGLQEWGTLMAKGVEFSDRQSSCDCRETSCEHFTCEPMPPLNFLQQGDWCDANK